MALHYEYMWNKPCGITLTMEDKKAVSDMRQAYPYITAVKADGLELDHIRQTMPHILKNDLRENEWYGKRAQEIVLGF